jgi:hypothetical protein
MPRQAGSCLSSQTLGLTARRLRAQMLPLLRNRVEAQSLGSLEPSRPYRGAASRRVALAVMVVIGLEHVVGCAQKKATEFITVVLKDGGPYIVAGVETKPSDLERALRELRASRPEAELHLRGDDQLKYQTVVEVVKLAEKLGFPGVGYDPLVKR